MHYIRIKEEYINYLKQKDDRIPDQDYGFGKYKPFYILNELDGSDVLYATQLTSPKQRHYGIKEGIDFKKLYHPGTGKLLGATNLNYMFPVLPEYIEHLSFHELKNILKEDYKVKTLAIEKSILSKRKDELTKSFHKVYQNKYEKPYNNLANRCLDFKELEANMLEFKLQEQFERDDIKVERSNDHSTFFIHTPSDTYEYSESILNDMYGFVSDMNDNLAFDAMQVPTIQEEQNLDI